MIRYYLRQFRGPLSIAVVSLGIVNLVEAILPILLKRAFDIIQFGGELSGLRTVAFTYFGLAIVQMACRAGWRLTISYSGTRAAHLIRTRIAAHLIRLPEKDLKGRSIGEQMALCSNDVDAVKGIIDPGTVVFCDPFFNLLFYPAAMLYLSPSLTVAACLPALLMPLVARFFQRAIAARFSRVQEAAAAVSGRVFQDLAGIRIIKSFSREGAFLQRFSRLSGEYAGRIIHCAKIESLFSPSIEGIATAGVLLCLVYAVPQVQAEVISIGTMVAFLQYIRKLMWPLQAVGIGLTVYQKAKTSAARLEAILSIPVENCTTGADAPPGRIEFNAVTFRYPGESKEVLRSLSFSADPGERIAILGETGSGKSTIFSLLLRVYEPSSGHIRIGGRPIDEFSLDSLRTTIALAPQDPFLFDGSIRDNIAAAVSKDLLARAGLDRDLQILPSGIESPVGERGRSLSGGQRLRVGLARALARNPRVLLLDDPFSALDTATAAQVANQLSAVAPETTLIFTTQRLSAVKLATRILVLKDGAIAQSGTHQELAAQEGWYAGFVRHGALEEALDAR